MSDCPFHSQLGAFHDGQLDATATHRFQEHLPVCGACQAELIRLAKMTQLFGVQGQVQMLPLELARLHMNLDKSTARQPAEAEFLRTAGMLSALAASILVISSVWLAEFPSRHTAALSPGVAVVPASDSVGMPAELPDWERTALTLRVDPLPGTLNPGAGELIQIPEVGLADSRSVGDNGIDAQVADWMVAGLAGNGAGHANP